MTDLFDDIPVNNNIVNLESIKTKKNIELNTGGYYKEKYYIEEIFDGKEFNKIVKNIESKVRTSQEYSHYIGYLKNEIGLTNCVFLNNISDEMAEIEMHHYPFTLFDIVSIVLGYRLDNKDKVSTFLIVQEVLDLHYENLIGVVPLTKTVHELVHNGSIFINLKQVFGNVNEFVKRYESSLSEEYIKNFNYLIDLSEANTIYNEDNILKIEKIIWNIQKNNKLDINDI
jgi:hypothetical protein